MQRYACEIVRNRDDIDEDFQEDPAQLAWRDLAEGRRAIASAGQDGDGYTWLLTPRRVGGLLTRTLSPMQERATALAVRGCAHKWIASELGSSTSAVSQTLRKVRRKLQMGSGIPFSWIFEPSVPYPTLRLHRSALLQDRGPLDGDSVLVRFYPVHLKCPDGLTAAEREVTALVLAGKSNNEIAVTRATSVRTVANQLASIYRKKGVVSRAELRAAPTLCRSQ